VCPASPDGGAWWRSPNGCTHVRRHRATAVERWTGCARTHGLAVHHIVSAERDDAERDVAEVTDPDGRVHRALSIDRGQALLVRPDGFVGRAGTEPDDLTAHLRRIGRHAAPTTSGQRSDDGVD
jgi:hypothetical protein